MRVRLIAIFYVLLGIFGVNYSAAGIIDFEDAPLGPLSTDYYAAQGIVISGASIFRVPIGSWASAHSGVQGLYASNIGSSVDGTTWQNVLATHGIVESNTGGAIADVHFYTPGTNQPISINSFSIGYGYDADGGESFQAVVIQAFDSSNNIILDVSRQNLYYDGFELFSAPGAVRLRLTQNGYVGFDDLSIFHSSSVPEPSCIALFTMATLFIGSHARRGRNNLRGSRL